MGTLLPDSVILSIRDAANSLSGFAKSCFQAKMALARAEEQHWNGTHLTALDRAVAWAKTMTWNGMMPIVCVVSKAYERGAGTHCQIQ